MEIFMKLVYQYMAIFLNFSLTSNHLHPLQVENCDSNSRLVVDEDDNVKSGLKGFKGGTHFVHAFTETDTTFAVYRRGKAQACSLLRKRPNLRAEIAIFYNKVLSQ